MRAWLHFHQYRAAMHAREISLSHDSGKRLSRTAASAIALFISWHGGVHHGQKFPCQASVGALVSFSVDIAERRCVILVGLVTIMHLFYDKAIIRHTIDGASFPYLLLTILQVFWWPSYLRSRYYMSAGCIPWTALTASFDKLSKATGALLILMPPQCTACPIIIAAGRLPHASRVHVSNVSHIISACRRSAGAANHCYHYALGSASILHADNRL